MIDRENLKSPAHSRVWTWKLLEMRHALYHWATTSALSVVRLVRLGRVFSFSDIWDVVSFQQNKETFSSSSLFLGFCSFSSKLFYFVAKNWLQCRIKSQLSVGETSLSGTIVMENKEKSIKWDAFNLFMTQLLREKRWKGLLDLRKSIFSSFEPVLPQLGIHF